MLLYGAYLTALCGISQSLQVQGSSARRSESMLFCCEENFLGLGLVTLCLCFSALLYQSLLVNEAHPVILHVQDSVVKMHLCVLMWHAAFFTSEKNLHFRWCQM